MKYLILTLSIFLFSCGKKNEEYPPFEKINTELDKSQDKKTSSIKTQDQVAQYSTNEETNKTKEIKGFVNISSLTSKKIFDKIPFSNSINLKKLCLDILTSNHNDRRLNNLNFSNHKIYIHKNSNDLKIEPNDEYKINFEVNLDSEKGYIHVKEKDQIESFEVINNSTYLVVSGVQLKKIIERETEIYVSDFDKEILVEFLERPFIIITNETESSVKYFSSHDEMNTFIQENDFTSSLFVNDYSLFGPESYSDEPTWFTSITPSHYKIFSKTTFKELHKNYLEKLQNTSSSLIRKGGYPSIEMTFSKSLRSKFFLKISGEVQSYLFKDKEVVKKYSKRIPRHRGHTTISISCKEFHREVASQKMRKITQTDLETQIQILTEQHKIDMSKANFVTEINENNQNYFIFGFSENFSKARLQIKGLPTKGQVQVGFYKQECVGPLKQFNINHPKYLKIQPEHHFKINVEALVENFEE